jgi:hypothetical protein
MTLRQLRIRSFRVVAVATTLNGALAISAQIPFSLDEEFRTTIEAQNVNSMLVLADGKLFLSGQIRYAGDGLSFRGSSRLLQDGSRDLTYGAFWGGSKITAWTNGMFYASNGLVRRFTPNAAFDPAFQDQNADPYYQIISGSDYHVFPDGRVVVTGAHQLSDVARGFVGQYNWVWFTNTGRLDTTRIHRQANFPTGRFAALLNGQFICHGQGSSFDGQTVDKLFKLHADGSVDTSFHSGVYWGVVFSFLPLADGRFYAGGSYMTDQLPGDSITIGRFLPDGSLDPSFSIPEFDLGDLTQTYGPLVIKIVPLPNGNIIAAGKFQYVNGQPRGGICLLDSNGVLLDAFANASVGTYVYMNYEYTSISDIVIDSTNNYLYLCGAYAGYSDGITSDPTQRFVTRLHLGDIMTGTAEVAREDTKATLSAHPNPASTWVAISYSLPSPAEGKLVIRDAQGRVLERFAIQGEEGQIVWDSRRTLAGAYTVEAEVEGATLVAIKLIIQP